ncbi:hypothetical protein CF319_g8789 [Tilletia indica]|nr:hypothetical protein CF319_g8789 [Tilletia indica]KAE8221126.1 hypothetical protein CF326_g8623 [Tilletia indica]
MSGSSKYPTHLSISADIISDEAISKENNHDIPGTIYLPSKKGYRVHLHMWSRHAPSAGAFCLSNCPIAPNPGRISVPDLDQYRQVPEAFDGSDPESPTLPEAPPLITGLGVVKNVDANKKGAWILGYTFINKDIGWAMWEIYASFEAGPRFAAWNIPPVRSLVAFEGVLVNTTDDDKMEIRLRRMSYIDGAGRPLLQALGFGSINPNDRAAKLREIREAKAAKRPLEEIDNSDAPAGPETPTAQASIPQAELSKTVRSGTTQTSPPTPSPAPGARKRGKVDA